MRLLTVLKMRSFHSLRAACSTFSRVHHRLPNSFKAAAISSLHLLKSILERSPIELIFRILESGIIIFLIPRYYVTYDRLLDSIALSLYNFRSQEYLYQYRDLKIKNDRSNRFVILIANYGCFSILKISWNG